AGVLDPGRGVAARGARAVRARSAVARAHSRPGVVRSSCRDVDHRPARLGARRSEPTALGPDGVLALARPLRMSSFHDHLAPARSADHGKMAIALAINVAMLAAGVVGGI